MSRLTGMTAHAQALSAVRACCCAGSARSWRSRSSAQARLDKIVVHIAANMVAEVCSVYVLRADGVLELYATEGLNREAVHLTTMRVGRGPRRPDRRRRAEPLNLSDAQAHPAFSYKPETGEEIYHSFLGVPVLRAGNTLGVLVVQNRAQRIYSRGGGRGAADHRHGARRDDRLRRAAGAGAAGRRASTLRRPIALDGRRRSPTASASAMSCCTSRASSSRNLIAEDTERGDRAARRGASADCAPSIDDAARARRRRPSSGEHRDVLETFRMFAHDRGWLRRLRRGDPHRPHGRGGGRARADRHPRPHACARPTPTCASGCTISTISPTACCAS